FFIRLLLPPISPLFPYTTLFRSRFILYQSFDPKTQVDLWVLPMFGDRKPFPFLQAEFSESQAQMSPDGRWVAYSSDETSAPDSRDRKSTRLNSSHDQISYAVFCL